MYQNAQQTASLHSSTCDHKTTSPTSLPSKPLARPSFVELRKRLGIVGLPSQDQEERAFFFRLQEEYPVVQEESAHDEEECQMLAS